MLTAGIADLMLDILAELQPGYIAKQDAVCPSFLLLGPPGAGTECLNFKAF